MMRCVESRYWHGDIVYLRVRDEAERGMIVAVKLYPSGVTYSVQFPNSCTDHYEYELSAEYVPEFASVDKA